MSKTHKQLGIQAHSAGELEQAAWYYREALIENSTDAELLILLGNAHRELEDFDAAKAYYTRAIEIDLNNAFARINLDRLSQLPVPIWHIKMLSDVARNDAFDSALNAVVKPNSLVLDIGAGSGLLSMMAVRAGAKNVHAVELIPEVAEAAKAVIADNGMQEQITVHCKNSAGLEIGVDLPEKADVLVSEILDAGLLGEGVLPTFRHALKHLVKPDAQIIPKEAEVFGMLIQADELKSVTPVQNISGFDLSAFDKFRVQEPYHPITLSEENHERLSDFFPIYEIDFTNLPAPATITDPEVVEFTVSITQDGELHGIAFWFDMYVNDKIVVSSGPDGEMISWGQAVQFFDEVHQVSAGDEIRVKLLRSETLLRFALD